MNTAMPSKEIYELLERLQQQRGRNSKLRQAESDWVARVRAQPVVDFADVQIAVELIALHRWEDSRRMGGIPSDQSAAALVWLQTLWARRRAHVRPPTQEAGILTPIAGRTRA